MQSARLAHARAAPRNVLLSTPFFVPVGVHSTAWRFGQPGPWQNVPLQHRL